MANKTLAEAKAILKTEKIHEVDTAFLVNDFGKYRPNITFVIPKEFDHSPIAYRSDEPTRRMLANLNIDFDGETSVIFGDFWVSRKGGACFRPKEIAEAKHVLVKCGWGGAFSRTRGIGYVQGVLYYRRAASNGGGVGSDYLVVPVGFCRALHDEEVDGDTSSASPDFAKRAEAIREAFMFYDQEQADKAAAAAKAKAEAEAASRKAKLSGLGERMVAVNDRRRALDQWEFELGETYFGTRTSYSETLMNERLYTEANVAAAEREVTQLEAERAEKERKRLAREQFQPKFEAFKARAEAIGISIEFGDETVRLAGEYYGQPYSDEGLAKFVADLDKREREVAEARAKAQAEVTYQTRKTEAAALGLPTDIRIWHRNGRTNAGRGWVISSNGMDRECNRVDTSMLGSNTKRYHQSYEGDHIWDQVLAGEVVLKWSKVSSAALHEFEVIHLPAEGLTEAQLERIREIQDELESEWEGARGLASGLPSPPVGEGWGLLPQTLPPSPVTPVSEGGNAASVDQLAALRDRFKK